MGLLILICAFVIFALPFYVANLPEKVLDKVCSSPRDVCTSNSAVKMNAPQKFITGGYTAAQQRICRADLKEFWGCKATPPKGLDPADYECTQMKKGDALVAELYERWQTAMWLVGGFGGGVLILLVVIPAFIAACSTNSNVVLYCFGVNCFIWCFPYLFIGCCFYVIAAGMDPSVKWGPFTDPQAGVLAMSCVGTTVQSNCGQVCKPISVSFFTLPYASCTTSPAFCALISSTHFLRAWYAVHVVPGVVRGVPQHWDCCACFLLRCGLWSCRIDHVRGHVLLLLLHN
jgi:hypothetical protein